MRKFAVQKMSLYRKMQYQNSINKQNNGRNRWEMVADCINAAWQHSTFTTFKAKLFHTMKTWHVMHLLHIHKVWHGFRDQWLPQFTLSAFADTTACSGNKTGKRTNTAALRTTTTQISDCLLWYVNIFRQNTAYMEAHKQISTNAVQIYFTRCIVKH